MGIGGWSGRVDSNEAITITIKRCKAHHRLCNDKTQFKREPK